MAGHDHSTPIAACNQLAFDFDAAAEAWKSIPEFAGYEASDLGRIRSFWRQAGRNHGYVIGASPIVLKPRPSRKGYLRINLRHDSGVIRTEKVNHLILWAFVGPCPDGMVCCHAPDNDKANNRIGNLRWDTQRENVRDMGRCGIKRVLQQDEIDRMIRLDEAGVPRSEIAATFGIARSCVTKAMNKSGRPPVRACGGRRAIWRPCS